MLEANVKNGKVQVKFEGSKTEILADLTVLCLSVFEGLEEATGIPADVHKTVFHLGLKVH